VAPFTVCTGGAGDAVVPGSLPLTLAGEASPSGTNRLHVYQHSSGTLTMTVRKAGADLEFRP
jgi:hypothetical protein